MEATTENKKCRVTDGKFVEPCKDLAAAAEEGHPRGRSKGIYAWNYSNDFGPTRRFFGAKTGEFVSKGIAFNYCPFCGEKIEEPFASEPPEQPEKPDY